ncbi:glycosyltransferase family 2 protein [Microbacterium sp. Sa4CUA7]|uniref:Glycosyltransferase family 2 protein n=1 Tax=Microbacterium pullorum TaxID=2762236 RepID=A0ABR8S669_9MICO|nr:glycosyltransferase family 2 protein [Microbacterium pullorum]MBD7958574.1 glycosyltransferase family 2 protein [Microbacterium pullorum]
MSFEHIVVVMPAYNEAPGIAEFLLEIHEHVAPLASRLDIIVADDRSTDATAAVVAGLDVARVQVQTQARNRGHGPSALAAYRAGLAVTPDVIVHVDGDGQFAGADIARVIAALDTAGVDIVHGVRRGREDPWYRRALSFGLRIAVRPFAGRGVPDINTPLRAYRPEQLRALIEALGADAIVPHVHFSLAEARAAMPVAYVSVRSLPRRGGGPGGTMWGSPTQPKVPPKRLRAFVRQALAELWQLSLRPGAPMRSLSNGAAERSARVADDAR